MARPVEYDLEKVLDKSMEIFWQKGYEGVSMADLVSHTGLNRRTMYALFQDKEGLFKKALDNYYAQRSSAKLTLLQDNRGKKGIELFFQSFSFDKNFKGCLFSNTMREKQFMDKTTYEIPKNYFEKLKEQLEVNLKEAKEDETFHGDCKAMALTLITLVHGFHVHGKYNHSKQESQLIIENILTLIA